MWKTYPREMKYTKGPNLLIMPTGIVVDRDTCKMKKQISKCGLYLKLQRRVCFLYFRRLRTHRKTLNRQKIQILLNVKRPGRFQCTKQIVRNNVNLAVLEILDKYTVITEQFNLAIFYILKIINLYIIDDCKCYIFLILIFFLSKIIYLQNVYSMFAYIEF